MKLRQRTRRNGECGTTCGTGCGTTCGSHGFPHPHSTGRSTSKGLTTRGREMAMSAFGQGAVSGLTVYPMSSYPPVTSRDVAELLGGVVGLGRWW